MTTIKQDLSAKVYQKINQRNAEFTEIEKKQYASMAYKLPVLLKKTGLIETMAYLHDSKLDPQKDLFSDVVAVLAGENVSVGDYLNQLFTADNPAYRLDTYKAYLALSWFKRFARSVLHYEPGQDD